MDFKYTSDLDSLIPRLETALDRSIDLSLQELWGNVMQNSPRDPKNGRLAGSWTYRKTGFMSGFVGTNVHYALIQNDGVDPFMIYPRSKQALHWPGADHPVTEVMHPGFAGTQYIEGSIAQAEGRHSDFVHHALSEVNLI